MSGVSMEGTGLQQFIASSEVDWKAMRHQGYEETLSVVVTDSFPHLTVPPKPTDSLRLCGPVAVLNGQVEVDALNREGLGYAWRINDMRRLPPSGWVISARWEEDAVLAVFLENALGMIFVWTPGESRETPMTANFKVPVGCLLSERVPIADGPVVLGLWNRDKGQWQLGMVVPRDVKDLWTEFEPKIVRAHGSKTWQLVGALAVLGIMGLGVALYRGDIKLPPQLLSCIKDHY